MSRLRADLYLLLAALIWGLAFVAQKYSFDHVGAYTFVAARFLISTLLILPLALRESRRAKAQPAGVALLTPARAGKLALLCLAFAAAVISQQLGVKYTSITNAGFLTGLYVVFVPLICWVVYKQKPSVFIFIAAGLSVLGVGLLSGISLNNLQINRGDLLVILCAVAFAVQITMVGRIMAKTPAPLRLAWIQYAAVTAIALTLAALFEHPTWNNIVAAAWPILYAGALSGGIAYTLQMVAQQYTPSSDSAIILSAESVFAALGGVLMANDQITAAGWAGCALIFGAILLVEFGQKIVGFFRPQP